MKYRILDKKSDKYVGEGGLFKDVSKAYKFDTKAEAEAEITWILQHDSDWLPRDMALCVEPIGGIRDLLR